MRAAYIGGGPTNVPYVPNPPLFLPFFHVSSQPNLALPTTSSTFASTLSSDRPRYSRPLLRLQAGWFIWFNDAFERGSWLPTIREIYTCFVFLSLFRSSSINDILRRGLLRVNGNFHWSSACRSRTCRKKGRKKERERIAGKN